MCKRLAVSVSVLVVVLTGIASGEVVDSYREWNERIQLNTIGGLEITSTGHAKFTARVDHDGVDVRIAAGGILETNNTYKLPDESGPSNVYVNGTWNAHDIESFGQQRQSMIYIGADGVINLSMGYGDDATEGRYNPLHWLDEGSLVLDPSLDPAAWLIQITDMGGGAAQITAEALATLVSFDSEASGDLESVSPAELVVVLVAAEEGQTYTVDYAVTGGTATGGGVDYSLAGYCDCDLDDNNSVNILDIAILVDNWLAQTPGNVADLSGDNNVNFQDLAVCAAEWLKACTASTLIFNPGETSKTISIDIIDDDLDEEDETIIVQLSNPAGPNVVLGEPDQHTYTIRAGVNLGVMSFNIKNDKGIPSSTNPDAWIYLNGPNRADRVFDMILSESDAFGSDGPDIIGVQEALNNQVDDMKGTLSDYDFYGVGRDDGYTEGEYCGILYRSDRFTRTDQGTFWLSLTPNVPGSRYPETTTRIASWVVLYDNMTEQSYFVLNSHWDHKNQDARFWSAQLIRQKIKEISGDLPLIVMGDLNCHEDNVAFLELVGQNDPVSFQLLDSYREVFPVRQSNERTGHGWGGGTSGSRIDFVLHSHYFEAIDATIERAQIYGRYPSDHYPVTATMYISVDLLVPAGTEVTKSTAGSYGKFEVDGRLIVESRADLSFTNESRIDGLTASGIRPEIIMNAGNFLLDNRMNMGTDKLPDNGGNYAYLTMNGGTFTVTGTFKFPDDPGGEHRIYLNDGIMHCGDIQLIHERNAIMYVGGGILRLDDITGGERDPQEWKANGDLLPAAGYDEIVIEYVPAGPYTEVRAIN